MSHVTLTTCVLIAHDIETNLYERRSIRPEPLLFFILSLSNLKLKFAPT